MTSNVCEIKKPVEQSLDKLVQQALELRVI